MHELLSGQAKYEELTGDVRRNLDELYKKMNIIRGRYGRPMIVTSGLRTIKHHLDIYAKKGLYPPKVPMKSNHLFGRACDISDVDGSLKKWCLDNINFLEEVGVWMEAFEATPTWVHFQINPPRSGNRFFKP